MRPRRDDVEGVTLDLHREGHANILDAVGRSERVLSVLAELRRSCVRLPVQSDLATALLPSSLLVLFLCVGRTDLQTLADSSCRTVRDVRRRIPCPPLASELVQTRRVGTCSEYNSRCCRERATH